MMLALPIVLNPRSSPSGLRAFGKVGKLLALHVVVANAFDSIGPSALPVYASDPSS